MKMLSFIAILWLFIAGVTLGGLLFDVRRNLIGNRILIYSHY